MKRVLLVCGCLLAIHPAVAQDGPAPLPEDDLGFFGETMRSFMEDLAKRMAPSLEEMRDELGPLLRDLTQRLGDLDAYHSPEILPNGDIIIRRKRSDEPTLRDMKEPPEGAIDL